MHNLSGQWLQKLQGEFSKDYFLKLQDFLGVQENLGVEVVPGRVETFRAFELCPLEKVKVVIIGQDPYHGPGQANGLAFSVANGVKIPPSLRNIYKELACDVNFTVPDHGSLEQWARQGILLINATLSVELGHAGSHQKQGWEQFTDKVVQVLNDEKEHLVFILWGNFAKKKALGLIDAKRHHVLTGVHPSPLSASRGFFGCRHFSKSNTYLKSQQKIEINWQL